MSEQDRKNHDTIRNLNSLIRTSLYIISICILVLGGVFAFVIVNKENPFSQWVVDKSLLGNYIKLNNNQLKQSQENKTNSPIGNNLLGLNPDASDTFKFESAEKSKTVVEVVENVLPTVLSISVTIPNSIELQDEKVAGTGYVVDKSGLVVTNKHVIAPACLGDKNIIITGVNAKESTYTLKLLSVDPIEDIAILQIQEKGEYPSIKFADSTTLKLGTEVIAIGNALGSLQNTVTKGIVSGLGREIKAGNIDPVDQCTQSTNPITPDSLIQTDAAINRGNSGGPLFNSSGQIIGMNTYGTGGENIGLAIPSSRIVAALNSFQKNGKIVRPRLGVITQYISPSLKKRNNWLPVEYGEIVYNRGENPIILESGAQKAGIKEGDIILAVNGTKLEKTENLSSPPLKRALLNFQSGDTVELTLLKSTGKTDSRFNYNNKEEKVQVQLGGQSFDLPKDLLQ